MLSRTLLCLSPRTLSYMFRKLKLAGAHPDILWAIDPQKAQHNGQEMIRLETLFHDREKKGNSNAGGSSKNAQEFVFWLKPSSSSNANGNNSSGADGQRPQSRIESDPTHAGGSDASLLRVARCRITPGAPNAVVHRQLSELFASAGVLEDFELSAGSVEMGLESVLRAAEQKMDAHLTETGDLYVRGDRAVSTLRQYGVLLAVADGKHTYLVSMPETMSSGSGKSAPGGGLYTSSGEVDEDAHRFMAERGLRAFDLRMAGGHASVERFVSAFEQLERLYAQHRGRALRTAVCLLISLQAPDHYVAPDGCIVLSLARQTTWEEYLFSLPQAVWQECVRLHGEWRLGYAPGLAERKRQLMRVAEFFHLWQVRTEDAMGGAVDWQQPLISRLLKEEAVIRRTIGKYNIKSDYLRKKGSMVFLQELRSCRSGGDDESEKSEIGYRISGDGTLYINQRLMNTGKILRVLKDNLASMEAAGMRHERAVTALERLSRQVPVDFSVDTEWKAREESNFVHCLESFVATMRTNEAPLKSFLGGLRNNNNSSNKNSRAVNPSMRRMVWVISDHYDVMPSGVVFIPYNVDFESIKRILLSR